MREYRVNGLSCANCAEDLEKEIKRLDYGETASLSYRSGKLRIDERMALDQIRRILRSDGAAIALPAAEAQAGPDAAAQVLTGEHAEGQDHAGHDHAGHDHAGHEHAGHEHAGHDHAGHGHGSTGHAGHDHDAPAHEGHSHGEHDHDHGTSNHRAVVSLIVSTIIYAGALIVDARLGGSTGILLYAAAAVLSGYTTFMRGLKNLAKLKFNIDTLMTVALVGAAAIGDWKEATLVAILFGLNEWLEGLGMEKARRSMASLLSAAPKEATKLTDGGETVVPIASLRAGDLVVVKAGEKIPSDGTIENGRSSVNEAAITGESIPVDKAPGETVYGGSINNEGLLQVRIAKAYEDSSLARILHLVEEAQETKTPTELFINRFARYYTPMVMIVAALVLLVPPLFFGGSWSKWLYQGLAVLIVGCPCALILSSPIAIVSGIARNARNGILVKGGVHLEQLGKLDTLAFDKTGTLTEGEPYVVETVVYDENRFFAVAGAIEQGSAHPLARAVMREIGSLGLSLPEAAELVTIPGRGVEARIGDRRYRLGNEQSAAELSLDGQALEAIRSLKDKGLTLVLLSDDQGLLGMFGIADRIREESRSVVQELYRSGIRRTVMLTGDHAKTAEQVAAAAGVSEYYAGLMPEDKVAKVKELAAGGTIGMIGDGINDAPALASADLGIAMGKGTDSAIETADVVLMQDHLGKLPEAIRIGRRVNGIIRFNIGVAMGLKLLALLLTIPGWLTLWIAILSDMGATIFVTLVSLTVLIQRNRS
ncbi:heavy metal translocating P-type ATPase [Cohnella nanjingensis]|uniref:Cd(2+)-exporting ATPase n=1 Tax=Cohnella nanjingensis TaxID=1387779 RepID=A0A7X0RV75_9BACL|nr:heavy metal translocating P-type ATPase [Cohnella nanjingensis]MBB6672709.1 cadmium-translocating P-type ATPase [Cohnella nanjingensis]